MRNTSFIILIIREKHQTSAHKVTNARINRQNSIQASRTIDQVKCELKAGTAAGAKAGSKILGPLRNKSN